MTPGRGNVGTSIHLQDNFALNGYSSSANADKNGGTSSQGLTFGSASEVLILLPYSGNDGGDSVSGEIQISGSTNNKATVNKYNSAAKATNTEASIGPSLFAGLGDQTFESAFGDYISSYTAASYRPTGDYVLSGGATLHSSQMAL